MGPSSKESSLQEETEYLLFHIVPFKYHEDRIIKNLKFKMK